MATPEMEAAEANLPYGLVHVSAQKYIIVRTGVLFGVPLAYYVEGEPPLRSLAKGIARVKELNAGRI